MLIKFGHRCTINEVNHHVNASGFDKLMQTVQERLRHGTIVETQDGLPVRQRDRRGNLVFEGEWQDRTLLEARFRLPDGRQIVVKGQADEHLLFGKCDTISLIGGPPLARFQTVDWARPAYIPPLDRPGALPSGAGTAILNLLAQQTLHSERQTLRYRGPYPTGALFDALLECFHPQEDVSKAFVHFMERVEETSLSGEISEPPVDFVPDPFERVWFRDGICIQWRDGVEKVYVNGRAYQRNVAGPRRVHRTNDGYTACLELAGEPWAEVVRLDEQGEPVEGPKPLPLVANRFVGHSLPDSVRVALVEVLPSRAPGLMQTHLRQVLMATPVAWGDPGDDVAKIQDDTIVLHAVLLERLAGRSPHEILTAIALAIEPVAQRLAQARLARMVDHH
jgi:hypothetical protein